MLVDRSGDGILATFDGPARAIRCAWGIRDSLQRAGLEVRTGLHTGEVTQRQLRTWLVERLPTAVHPGRIVVTEALPRTTAGKVDRVSLARGGGS